MPLPASRHEKSARTYIGSLQRGQLVNGNLRQTTRQGASTVCSSYEYTPCIANKASSRCLRVSARRIFLFARIYRRHSEVLPKYTVIYEIAYINNFEYSRRRGCTTVKLNKAVRRARNEHGPLLKRAAALQTLTPRIRSRTIARFSSRLSRILFSRENCIWRTQFYFVSGSS